jgi:hypothetical protein
VAMEFFLGLKAFTATVACVHSSRHSKTGSDADGKFVNWKLSQSIYATDQYSPVVSQIGCLCQAHFGLEVESIMLGVTDPVYALK